LLGGRSESCHLNVIAIDGPPTTNGASRRGALKATPKKAKPAEQLAGFFRSGGPRMDFSSAPEVVDFFVPSLRAA
jgi:hypothetical protein